MACNELISGSQDIYTGDSVIVIPFTSAANVQISTRIAVMPNKANGLDRDCFLEVDKISAISRVFVGSQVGVLDSSTLKNAHAMTTQLISRPNPKSRFG